MICKVCGKEFIPKRNQRICSEECKRKRQAVYMHNYYLKINGREDEIEKEVPVKKEEVKKDIQAVVIPNKKMSPLEIDATKIISRILGGGDKERRTFVKQKLREVGGLVKILSTIMEQCLEEENKLEKYSNFLDHELESYEECPNNNSYCENYTIQKYQTKKARRIVNTDYEALYACIGNINQEMEKIFDEKQEFQDKLNEQYAQKKEWNTDKWKDRNPRLWNTKNKHDYKRKYC